MDFSKFASQYDDELDAATEFWMNHCVSEDGGFEVFSGSKRRCLLKRALHVDELAHRVYVCCARQE